MAQTERDGPAGGDFISRLVTDPNNPPQVQQVTGYLGAAGEPGRRRIYLDTSLQNYVEVLEDKVLHAEPREIKGQPGLSAIWLAADAQIFLPAQPRIDARSYFGGAIYQDYLGRATALAGPGTAILLTARIICNPPTYFCTQECPFTYRCPLTHQINCYAQIGGAGLGGDPLAQQMAAAAIPAALPSIVHCPSYALCTQTLGAHCTSVPLCYRPSVGEPCPPQGRPLAQQIAAPAVMPEYFTFHCLFTGHPGRGGPSICSPCRQIAAPAVFPTTEPCYPVQPGVAQGGGAVGVAAPALAASWVCGPVPTSPAICRHGPLPMYDPYAGYYGV